MKKKNLTQQQYMLIVAAHVLFSGGLLAAFNLNLIPGLALEGGMKLIISAVLLADLLIFPLILKTAVRDN
ncbi:hypothetical protein COW36_01415 [bacterium (Candidatus Blackallbacteria) CG17_big_fil_post_rev_8_21_14_2_50_48_46]|uniref:Uncharacterized protein n=1 Tax=bacterium (Candidatus Blackallbacteria) CG17_big_fil_post_rev_8_21_14_2_50_48_46 TaxID=2014261 RepID=A0A2M7GBH0_9BACT|nr:MAG: hypothetical protein COW64_09760 [bacterium (Candidatus Blackallbacteria) CG18_big_fil_WC_8_21_14_2_50_49_26]PIW19526.1 MAG: hypothetical protein COW36_01415 [bacterium (Candidatus Blackallbacteria) CG17_big_fil_post_rev_8_21_14_2_50_48_46]PIW48870.1 MAG: hypothetical protein COW20_07040 [bacterium (Candidatus Blackallbacteria) CG13_big_fil_rev_8_21_14_2_50_49_14]